MNLKRMLKQNVNNCLLNASIPELELLWRGKVRESYRIGRKRLLIATDRISAYDRIMARGIPFKGQVLNQLAHFWFEQTKDIVKNHVIDVPDPNAVLGVECKPYPVEVVVRQYLAGSAWRTYQKTKTVCGIRLPDGLKENSKLPKMILTPTTKAHEGHDEDITRDEILKSRLVSKKVWEEIETAALALFRRGTSVLAKRGLTLVDTKYEFGDNKGQLTLIDEIHTPDSSRFWGALEKDLDKEYLRRWLREKRNFLGDGPVPELPDSIVTEIARRYIHIYETVVGHPLEVSAFPIEERLKYNLMNTGLIRGKYVVILMASERDAGWAKKILAELEKHRIPARVRVGSAHKVPDAVLNILGEYEQSLAPLVFITVAGRSDALSGTVAANTRHPVIACPPDFNSMDVFSSIRTPSYVPPMLVLNPENAAMAAAKIFRSPTVLDTMRAYKNELLAADRKLKL